MYPCFGAFYYCHPYFIITAYPISSTLTIIVNSVDGLSSLALIVTISCMHDFICMYEYKKLKCNYKYIQGHTYVMISLILCNNFNKYKLKIEFPTPKLMLSFASTAISMYFTLLSYPSGINQTPLS